MTDLPNDKHIDAARLRIQTCIRELMQVHEFDAPTVVGALWSLGVQTTSPFTLNALFGIDDDGDKSPCSQRAAMRPYGYDELTTAQQWEVDKRLGTLDWNGK